MQQDLFVAGSLPQEQQDDIVPGIRARVMHDLAAARAEPSGTWTGAQAEIARSTFHLWSHFLPLEERLVLRAEYRAELARLVAPIPAANTG